MKTVLIVEDDQMNRDMLLLRLKRRGYEISIAENGLEGVEFAQNKKPDVIVMDMSLPVLDGWEATRRIKADPSTANIPVIALTAHAMSVDRVRSMEAGCDAYLTKPVDFTKLIDTIESLSP